MRTTSDAVKTDAEIAALIRAREAEILGKPPRVLPVDRESVADEVRAVTNKLRGGVVGDGRELPLAAIPEIMFVLCRYPEVWDRIMALSLQVQGPSGILPVRTRQLAILRTAWLCLAPYEWGEHVKHSHRVGFTSEEIERVVRGSSADAWEEADRAVLRAAEELHEDAMIGDGTWAQLSSSLDDAQIFELIVVIGQFTHVAYFQNSLRLRLEPGNKGLASR